ncbi:hypothetical protein ACSQ67_009334 [Phaseolus vulgaris]
MVKTYTVDRNGRVWSLLASFQLVRNGEKYELKLNMFRTLNLFYLFSVTATLLLPTNSHVNFNTSSMLLAQNHSKTLNKVGDVFMACDDRKNCSRSSSSVDNDSAYVARRLETTVVSNQQSANTTWSSLYHHSNTAPTTVWVNTARTTACVNTARTTAWVNTARTTACVNTARTTAF